jgi:putative endonuclease
MNSYNKGLYAQAYAIEYLKRLGYRIIAENVYINYGEIDIIACEKEQLVFIEVKSLASDIHAGLEELLSKRKLLHLYRSVSIWLMKHDLSEAEARIDFLGLIVDNRVVRKVVYFKDIYNII